MGETIKPTDLLEALATCLEANDHRSRQQQAVALFDGPLVPLVIEAAGFRAERDAALAALQQVTAERDEDRAELHNVDLALEGLVADTPRAAAICRWIGQCQTAEDQRDTATSELARLRAEGEAKDRRIATLTEALAPFARFGDMATPDTAETWAGVHHTFRIGTRFKHEHFRAARAATAREG